jgi:starch synthase
LAGRAAGSYLRENYGADPDFAGAKSIITIHNLGYQGNFPAASIGDLGLSPALYHPGGLEFWGELSFLKSRHRMVGRDHHGEPHICARDPTPEYGAGLDGVLLDRAAKITGILNGVDYAEWSPTLILICAIRIRRWISQVSGWRNARCWKKWDYRSMKRGR